ncbi:dodecin domain-containing protein [Rhodococcus sp. 06-418-1B]|nr:dodecin domain-containing protein [Rhodococcus sp. 06-418-1B]
MKGAAGSENSSGLRFSLHADARVWSVAGRETTLRITMIFPRVASTSAYSRRFHRSVSKSALQEKYQQSESSPDCRGEKEPMSDNIYRVTEIVGTSTESTDDAIRKAIARANTTLNNLDWFEVLETRGHIENGSIAHFQVTIKVGFKLE